MKDEEVDALFEGGGAPVVKFANIGDNVTGTVVKREHVQQTTLEGEPKTWSDGNPMMQLVVTLQTDSHDDEEDDGLRRVFLKGSKSNADSAFGALAAALERTGSQLREGGVLSIEFVGVGVPTKKGYSPPKFYRAAYAPPEG